MINHQKKEIGIIVVNAHVPPRCERDIARLIKGEKGMNACI